MMPVHYNTERNGIELSFPDKPDDAIRAQLKAHGFRWSSNQGIWYAHDTQQHREYVDTLDATVDESERESATYPDIDIDDIHTYTIDKQLQAAEHSSHWIFRNDEPDQTTRIQSHFQQYTDAVKGVLTTTDSERIAYTLKNALQRYKRLYFANYTAQLRHRANNPSWAVTGRAGRNPRRDAKASNREDNLMHEAIKLHKQMDDAIDKAKRDIRQDNEQRTREQMERTPVDIEFTVKTQDVTLHDYTDRCRTYTHGEYMIAKTWGCFRIFRNGGHIHGMKSADKLDDAKKYVAMLINNHQEQEV